LATLTQSLIGFFAGTKIILNVLRLIPLTLALSFLALASLARGKIVLLFASGSLLAKLILVALACTTHVPVEIVVPHSVIRHVSFPPIVRC
jgi:hypothetical protein